MGYSSLSRLPIGHWAVQVWGFVVVESCMEAGLPDMLLVYFLHMRLSHHIQSVSLVFFFFFICLFVSQSALPALNYNYTVCVYLGGV